MKINSTKNSKKTKKKSENKSESKPVNKSNNKEKDKKDMSQVKVSINIIDNSNSKASNQLNKQSKEKLEMGSLQQSNKQSENQDDNQIQDQEISINEEAKTYFENRVDDEENPIQLGITTNIRYYNLENVFNSFYPIDSLPIAKNISREERINKKIKDPSFTYGEIVNKNILLILIYF